MIITLRIIGQEKYPIMDVFRTRKQHRAYEHVFGNPDSLLVVEEVKVSGTTYEEKRTSFKEQVRKLHQLMLQSNQSYGTLVEVQNWITSRATTFGLLKEFREEGII